MSSEVEEFLARLEATRRKESEMVAARQLPGDSASAESFGRLVSTHKWVLDERDSDEGGPDRGVSVL